MIKVVFGPNSTQSAQSGVTAREVLEKFADIWNIPSDTGVTINGANAELDDDVPEGGTVKFEKTAGQKGA